MQMTVLDYFDVEGHAYLFEFGYAGPDDDVDDNDEGRDGASDDADGGGADDVEGGNSA
jgi:hypothetical protein